MREERKTWSPRRPNQRVKCVVVEQIQTSPLLKGSVDIRAGDLGANNPVTRRLVVEGRLKESREVGCCVGACK
jgi:hypothetical protein